RMQKLLHRSRLWIHLNARRSRRWVPWICAYTGARVGEIVQLRKRDVFMRDGHLVINITPEAVTVKDGEARMVPLHPHLLEMGIEGFIQGSPDDLLFMWSGKDRKAWRTAKNRITEFVREHLADPNVQPNHAWRHTFKTRGAEAGIGQRILDAICGHEPGTVGEAYTDITVATMWRAMNEYPPYLISVTSIQEADGRSSF
ncbi:tyrosine-type recombinase/integrase, partial [Hoeflea sp. YIM 152468]|uniref:tyrosine-type recombinase/integrase n=1 Tax=Hoeflea sp. YIM 152468 TaxID=3031759 RepID=UPI0023DCA4E3